jgi:hypothetical protein
MFQINPDSSVRSITLSVNAQEKPVFNELFARFQELEGEKSFFKDLIFTAFQRANNATPENEVQELRNQVDQLSTALENQSNAVCICTPDEYQLKLDRIAELEAQVNSLQSQLDENENFEIEIPDESAIIENFKRNHVAFELNDDQRKALDQIISNRNENPKLAVYPDRSSIIQALALNRATLYNWAGEFYTGLT